MVSFISTFITTFVVMLLAEIADKTNLLALSLMGETQRPKTVALGGLVGITFVTIIGIAFSSIIQRIFPENLVTIISGIIFILLGLLGFLFNNDTDQEGEENTIETGKSNAFIKAASLIGLAEFGDKSQLFVISSALIGNPFAVFLGALMGMGVIMVLTMLFGQRMLQIVPEEALHRIASALFIIVGFWILFI